MIKCALVKNSNESICDRTFFPNIILNCYKGVMQKSNFFYIIERKKTDHDDAYWM